MVMIASATERRSHVRLINHALEQEGSMHLINNMRLTTRVYSNYYSEFIITLSATLTGGLHIHVW